MLPYLYVAAGGALGSVLRFWLAGALTARYGDHFPLGTLVVNVTGSFVLGLFAGLAIVEGRWWGSPAARLFLMVGLCGGYTTFSSFSLQTLALLQAGEWFRGLANVAVSVLLCLFAVWLGHAAGTLGARA